MSATANKPHRTPSICVDVDVSLDEFDIDDVAEYLRHHGYKVSGTTAVVTDDGASNVLDPDELEHVEHLVICGQLDAARAEALQLVSNAIGRSLQ